MIVFTVLLCTGIFFAHPILAASAIDQNAFASFAANAGFAAGPSITIIIARLIRTVISMLGVMAVVIVLWGGFMYMTSGGNDERVKKAKKILINGLIGLAIVLLSFTIAQFIVGRLVDATGSADLTAFCQKNPTDPTCQKNVPFPPPVPSFTLNAPDSIIQCAAGVRNLKLALVFSKSVKDEKGISVTKDGVSVAGSFAFSGQKVTFTPKEPCPEPNASLFCFAPNATFHVEVDPAQVKSASGATLTCKAVNGVNPCSFNFTTGSLVDTKPPKEVSFMDPQSGAKALLGLSKPLQVKTVDDTGVTSVEFFAADGDVPVDVSSIAVNPATANGFTTAFFNGSWLPVGFATNKSYDVWATATDCAGTTKTSSKVSVVLRAPNCDNGVQDAAAPYGETGTCAAGASCDCGGNVTSDYYCGLCKSDACTSGAQCSTGFCVFGKCQDVPVIQSVSPDNGATENLVTISGTGFGTTPGTVEFLGTEKDGTPKTVSAYQCGGTASWKDKEIVVQVPAGSVDGPLKVSIPATGNVAAQSERTDDSVGPIMSKFDVNAIKRPGLCSVSPSAAEVNTPIKLAGLAFGATQGSSSIYLTNFQATPIVWGTGQLTATVPSVASGTYQAQVFTGDYFCLNGSGEKVSPAITCFSDADCKKANAAYTCGTSWCSETLKFCQNNASCGASGGTCADVRVGSNTKQFTAINAVSTKKATIATIDTGWRSCSNGLNAGKSCSKDADCGGAAGSCVLQPTWGPSGQYVTLYGSGFGASTGYVKFENTTSGEAVNGNVEFPKACGDLFWHDDSVTVKVPFGANKNPIASGAYKVTVVPQSGSASEAKTFTVVDGKPTPGICLLSKSSGPAGTALSIVGENFGSEKGSVVFNANVSANIGSWTNGEIGSVSVPVGAKTGPVFMVDSASNQSNSVNFAVGNCQQTPSMCSAGQSCCTDGACSLANQACSNVGPKAAQFVYKVSTSPIPVAPTVVVNCTDPKYPKPSPSPSPLWSKQDDVCVSAAVTASFSIPMDPATIGVGNTNIRIEKCPKDKEANGTCAPADWQTVDGSFQNPGEYTFQWSPAVNFDTNTLYRVTVNGASAPNGGVKSKVNGLIPSASMAQDYSWQFRTSASNAACGVSGVTVSPDTFTAKNSGDSVGYLAQLISNNDKCVVLACAGHSLSWTSTQWAATFFPKNEIDFNPAAGVCTAAINPRYNTPTGDPAQIIATVTDVGSKPTNKGLLTIALTNPKVSDYFPNCSSACGNVKPWISFNVPMNPATLNANTISIYQCKNALCEENQLLAWNHVSGVTYDPLTYKAVITTDGTAFLPNTWYRTVVSGGVTSAVNALLSESGSNYGTLENKIYPKHFSWKFKSKETSASCTVDRIGLSPKTATLQYVGQRQEYRAIAYGAPDECSVTGQALQASGWSGWKATDTPDAAPPASFVDGANPPYDKITAFLLGNGSLKITNTLPKMCGGNCLFTGNLIKVGQAVCGNGVVNYGESCDDGNTNALDGCSSACLKEGSSAPTCGNKTVNAGEQCDDGNTKDQDGCSEKCLFEGASSIKSICGDGVVDSSIVNGGEACDDGNKKNADGCSSNCLFEGGVVAYSSARCGDGVVGTNETCDPGTHCANGAACSIGGAACQDGSTCSVLETAACSDVCLNRGTNPGKNPVNLACGNGKTDPGEDIGCDLITGIAQGCSKNCLKMGSSPHYLSPSVCGNGGALETGEQCEAAAASASVAYSVGPYAVAEVSSGASVEVEKDKTKSTYGYAISTVEVTVDGKTGSGEMKLLCSCAADNQCGVKTGTSESLGCGVEKCCFERPKITTMVPGNNATNVCRNTAISVVFDQQMDEGSFGSVDTDGNGKIEAAEQDPNLQLELISMKSAEGKDNPVNATNCPYYAKSVGLLRTKNLFANVWHWVQGLFGQPVMANATTQCFVPVTYEQDPGTHQVYLKYQERLSPLATYKLTVKTKNGNANGVLSKNKVSICLGDNGTTCQNVSQSNTFTTGPDVCLLDIVETSDHGITPTPPQYLSKSSGYYSKTSEVHEFSAKAFSYRKNTGLPEEISPLPNYYAWTWSWEALVKDVVTKTDILGINAPSTTKSAQYKALGKNGSGNVIATATISADSMNTVSTVKTAVSGNVSEIAFLCENSWPDLAHGVPFIENGANTNFSLFYCRDTGKPGEGKTLPALELPPTDATPDVNQLITTEVLKELVFRVSGTKDSIGIRVLSNPKFLSPMVWFKTQGFSGTPKAAKLDGYEAVQTGTTIYAAAANRNGSNLYSNIYVISFNADAGKEAQQIFDLVLQNFRLNANDTGVTGVSHVGLCKGGSAYVPSGGPFVACSWDGDCLDQCKPNGRCSVSDKVCDPKVGNAECNAQDPNMFCDADKQKLIRDTKRLTDITEMVTTFEKYGNNNGRCAVTKSQSCVVSQNSKVGAPQNPACPGTETCIPSYPTIQAGTFVPSMSNSIWPSWNSTLGNAVGGALPTDPLNQFWGQCKNVGTGYDSATCWNSTKGEFKCPDGSHIYGYQNLGGETYTLSTELEYKAVAWSNKIDDQTGVDHAIIKAAYGTGKAPANLLPGFTETSAYCNASTFGSSTICGDGVKGAGEDCEIGEVSSITCAGGGFINVTCKNDCKNYPNDAAAEAAAKAAGGTCKPFACGNGVKEGTEVCDDGALNGTYGHCGKNCTTASDFACGDGYLAGNEQCDCGTPTNFLTVKADANSWANKNCTVANGAYLKDGKNCTAECKAPGPRCGDQVVNDSSETCDGNTETYAGALNANGTKCTAASGCPVAACSKSKICTAGTNIGSVCNAPGDCPTDPADICKKETCNVGKCSTSNLSCKNDSDCKAAKCAISGKACTNNGDCAGKCSDEQYALTRTRTCQNYNQPTVSSCQWTVNEPGGGWGACAGGPQQCGNGKKEGTEECDDGNSSNNDICTNSCKTNVCGDNHVNVGIESCDSGTANGTVCNAAYGSSCNFCNQYCQYKTQSGPYCGDGVKNGSELCDGDDQLFTCFKSDPGTQTSQTQGTCLSQDAGKTGGKAGQTWIGKACDNGFTCRKLGVCNGGSRYGENGKACIMYGVGGVAEGSNVNNCDGYCSNDNNAACNHDADCGSGNTCVGPGACIAPICAPNCGSTCPIAYQKITLQVQGNAAQSQPSESIALFAIDNGAGKVPDRANVLFPACRVGVGLTADVSSNSTLLNVGYTVSLIAATFKDAEGKYINPQTDTSVLDIGNGLKLPLPSKFICHDVPFTLPLNVFLNSEDTSVTFKNIEFTYCPVN